MVKRGLLTVLAVVLALPIFLSDFTEAAPLTNEPHRGVTLIQLDGPTGNRYYTVSITDVTPSSLPGDQSEWEYWPGYDVTLRCEWETTGAPAFAQATSIAIRMVDPNGSTSPIGSTWNCQPGGSGSGSQTRTLHFDTNPLDESLGTNSSGMLEMYICASVGGLGGWSAESRSTSSCAGGLSNPVTNNWARGYIRSNIIITGSDTSKISFGGFEPDIFTIGDPTYNTVLHAIPYETFDRNISHIQYGSVLRTGESEGSDPIDPNTNVSFTGSESINTDYNLDEVDVNLNITNVTFDRDSKYVFNSTGHADGWTIDSPLSATYSDRFMVSAATNINDPIRLECPSDNVVNDQVLCDVNLYFLNGSSRTGATVTWFIFNGSSEASSFSGTASEFSSAAGTYWLNFTPTDTGVYRVFVNTTTDVGAGSDTFKASTRVRIKDSFLTSGQNNTIYSTNSIVASVQSVLNSLDTFLRDAWGDDTAETIKGNITDNVTGEHSATRTNLTSEINSAETSLTNLINTRLDAVDGNLTEIDTSISNLESRISSNFTDIRTRVNSVNDTLLSVNTSLQSRLDSIDASLNSIDGNITEIDTSLSNIETRMGANFTDIRDRLSNLNTTILSIDSSMDNNFTDMRSRFDSVDGNLTEVDTTLTNLETRVNDNFTDIRDRLTNINSTVVDIEGDVDFVITLLDRFESFVNTTFITNTTTEFQNTRTNFTIQFDNINVTEGDIEALQNNLTEEINNVTNEVWDETLTGATHNIPTSAGRILREISSSTFVIRENTAQGGTNNTITLDSGASSVNNIYDPARITIIDGTGEGQSRLIIEYNGTSKVAVVDKDWRINPDATSKFILNADIGGLSVNEGRLTGASANTAVLNADASITDNIYEGDTLFIFSGTGQDQSRIITAYDGSTKTATVNRDWDVVPDTTSGYEILPIGQTEAVLFGDDASENITSILNDIGEVGDNLTTVNNTVLDVGSNLTNTNTTIHSHIDETESDILDNTTSEINSAVTSIIAEVDAVASEVWTFTTRTVTSISQSIITRS